MASIASGVARLVSLGGHTPIFDCSIRVTQTNLIALIEQSGLFMLLHLELYGDVPAQACLWLYHCL